MNDIKLAYLKHIAQLYKASLVRKKELDRVRAEFAVSPGR